MFEPVQTEQAPQAIGTYSQAVKTGQTVYISGQIPLHPATMTIVEGDIDTQIHQVFQNLRAVAQAAGGDLDKCVKLTIYLTDLTHFPTLNDIIAQYFQPPYPARAAIGVAALPKDAGVEIEAIMALDA